MLFDALGFPLSRRESRRMLLAPPAYVRQLGNVRRAVFLGGGKKAPAAPTGLTATSGPTGIALTWTESAGDSLGTYIYRGTSPGGESATAIGNVAQGTAAYTDSTATPGTTYYYVVKAKNAAGLSPASNEVNTYAIAGLLAYGDSGLSSMFQLANGTMPATGTNPVGYWGDLTGNGNNATQGNSGDRAVLAQNALGSVQAVVGNGSNSELDVASLSYTTGNGMTLVCVARQDAPGTFPVMMDAVNAGAPMLELRYTNGAQAPTVVDSGGQSVTGSTLTLGTWHFFYGILVPATSLQLYVDGASAGINSTSIGSLTSPASFGLFNRPGASQNLQAGMVFWAIYNHEFSSGDAALMTSYLTTRFPSLP